MTQSSPWKAVLAGIAGLLLGYMFVLSSSSSMHAANSCPLQDIPCVGDHCPAHV